MRQMRQGPSLPVPTESLPGKHRLAAVLVAVGIFDCADCSCEPLSCTCKQPVRCRHVRTDRKGKPTDAACRNTPASSRASLDGVWVYAYVLEIRATRRVCARLSSTCVGACPTRMRACIRARTRCLHKCVYAVVYARAQQVCVWFRVWLCV